MAAKTASVSLAVEGEGADLAELAVARDLYYTTPLSDPFVVEDGHYFVLGDNTQDSSDSREWRHVVFERDGPDGTPWYRIFDDLDGSYFVAAPHLRVIPPEEYAPISPDVPSDSKHIEINLTTQVISALEYGKVVFQTQIASGIPGGPSGPNQISTTTPVGEFHVQEKMPAKHMGYSFYGSSPGNLLADADGYVLPGVSWRPCLSIGPSTSRRISKRTRAGRRRGRK